MTNYGEAASYHYPPLNSMIPLSQLPEIYKLLHLGKTPADCPVPIDELVYVRLPYLGFDNARHVGELIVHKELAQDILAIFTELYKNNFPIERISPIYHFHNDDNVSMAANNTSAYQCRKVTGQSSIISQHSYGRAIDINPQINPYVKKTVILPESGRIHVDRMKVEKGKIISGSLIYNLFKKRGWDWGGDWYDLQDYQHFEKRANGEKRDPNGYAS